MALEASVLNEQSVCELLKQHYGLRIVEMGKMRLGSANCYRVSDGTKDYFLKEFQSGFSESDLCREAELVSRLSESGFPTAGFLRTLGGARCISHCGHLLCVQEFIHGKIYGNNALPRPLLTHAAQLLGRLHTLLDGFDLPRDMGAEQVACYDPNRAKVRYDELFAAARRLEQDPNRESIEAALRYKTELLFRIVDFIPYLDGISYRATHGDFTEYQFICGEDRIRAVIDFSSARILPVGWEIMRCYIQSLGIFKHGKTLDIADFCAYVRDYLGFASLSRADLRALPYVYLFHLAQSQYGFREYLITGTANRDSLLRFALWRTDICRGVEACAEELSNALLSLL